MISKEQKIQLNQAIECFIKDYPMSKRSVSTRQLEVFYARLTHQSLESIETEAFAQWLVESEQLGFLQGIQKYKKNNHSRRG